MYKLSGYPKVSSKKNIQTLRPAEINENNINGEILWSLLKSISGGIMSVVNMPKDTQNPVPMVLISPGKTSK